MTARQQAREIHGEMRTDRDDARLQRGLLVCGGSVTAQRHGTAEPEEGRGFMWGGESRRWVARQQQRQNQAVLRGQQ